MSISIKLRTLVAFGSGLALALIVVVVFQAWRVDATPGGSDSTFVPIAPCRLFDYRPAPDTVGSRSTPLGPGEVHQQQVTGPVGDCTLPSGITGVALNVTAVGGTAPSVLTLYPSDLASAPKASNLNWVPGQPPMPNKVDVQVSPGGAIKLLNAFGSVYALADVAGYYTDDTLSDIADRLAALEARPTLSGSVVLEQGIGWISNAGNPATVDTYQNGVKINAETGGTAQLSIVGPVAIGSKSYHLESITYCVLPAPGGVVDEASIIGVGDDTTVEAEVKDRSDRTSDGCYTLTADAEVSARSTHHLMIYVVGTVVITEVTATWSGD